MNFRHLLVLITILTLFCTANFDPVLYSSIQYLDLHIVFGNREMMGYQQGVKGRFR